jgi:nitroimidazol reductase NimA-like FMN-containing flavoprotein (pyridoxamine 5'-phosphate oxidase superfamily)
VAEDPGRFQRLSKQECWRLLEAGTIGRVAWQAADGPEVLPVTYAVHDGLIVFRTSAYGPLADLINPRPVAFEIDELDVDSRSGWSVTARGPSRASTRADELVELWARDDPAPWAAGSRTLFIVIVPHTLSGRRISAPRDSEDDPSPAGG